MNAHADHVGPVRAIWRWNVRHSPIARRVRANRYATRLIAGSGLPAPVRARIDAIVRRTRLWASEREDVARELIAHARDAREAGRAEPETLASLGDPPPVARLIRRAMKRKRSWVYQARVWSARALGCATLALLLGYAALAARFYTGSPRVRTNYLALLNERNDRLPDGQKAYPVYREVHEAWVRVRARLRAESAYADVAQDTDHTPGVDAIYAVPKDHPDYAATAAAVRAFRPELDRYLAAAKRPSLGWLYSDRLEHEEFPELRYTRVTPLPPSPDPAEHDPLVGVILSPLAEARTMVKLLAFDARLAADEGDADRAERSLTGIVDVSAQLGREPFLISSLVAIAAHDLAAVETERAIHDHPGLFGASACTRLAHAFAGARPDALRLDLKGEEYFFDDFLQRAFTDDGSGNGRLTPEGLALLHEFSGEPDDLGPLLDAAMPTVSTVAAPAYMVGVEDRRHLRARYMAGLDEVRATLGGGPPSLADLIQYEHEFEARTERDAVESPVALFAPAYSRAVASRFQAGARADALAVVLAVEAWRAEHGRPPASLDELVPDALPSLPPDPFQPGTTIKYRADADGYAVYFAGADGDDDGGRRPAPDLPFEYNAGNLRLRYDPTDPPPPPDAETRKRTLMGSLYTADKVPDADWVVYPPRPDR